MGRSRGGGPGRLLLSVGTSLLSRALPVYALGSVCVWAGVGMGVWVGVHTQQLYTLPLTPPPF